MSSLQAVSFLRMNLSQPQISSSTDTGGSREQGQRQRPDPPGRGPSNNHTGPASKSLKASKARTTIASALDTIGKATAMIDKALADVANNHEIKDPRKLDDLGDERKAFDEDFSDTQEKARIVFEGLSAILSVGEVRDAVCEVRFQKHYCTFHNKDGEVILKGDPESRLWLIPLEIQKRASAQTSGDEAATAPDNDGPIIIRVRDLCGEHTFFKLKKTTEMEKLFQTYANRKGVQASHLYFLFNGERIEPDQTPQMLGLKDEDEIDCMVNGW